MALYTLMTSLISKVSWQRVKVEESENFLEEIWWASDTNFTKRENIQTKERPLQAKEMINTNIRLILPILVLNPPSWWCVKANRFDSLEKQNLMLSASSFAISLINMGKYFWNTFWSRNSLNTRWGRCLFYDYAYWDDGYEAAGIWNLSI